MEANIHLARTYDTVEVVVNIINVMSMYASTIVPGSGSLATV
jgi:hypothetical protein